jgi:hypothetical protein
MGDNGIDDYKNAGKLTTILIAMPPGRYGAMHITRWSTSVASCKATRSCHWASARAVLPRQLLWLTISNEKKILTKHNFYLAFSR